jgi:hypothetical protein
MNLSNLTLKDLQPGFQFSDLPAPPAIGPDARLFQHYADMLAAERGPLDRDNELTALHAAQRDGRPFDYKRLAAIEAADRKDHMARDKARDRFLATPALTVQGVLLKVAFGMSSTFVEKGRPADESEMSIFSAMVDLARMTDATEPLEAAVRRARGRRNGPDHRAAA